MEILPPELVEILNPGTVIVIEGCISSGKSRLIKHVADQTFSVPVHAFMEKALPEILDLYLSDMHTYAFAIQTIFFQERVNTLRDAITHAQAGGISLVDRGLAGDQAFAMLHHIKDNINTKEYLAYRALVDEALEQSAYSVRTVFLECESSTVMERLKKRGNPDEVNNYDEKYMKDLIDCHEPFLPRDTIRISWNNFIPELS